MSKSRVLVAVAILSAGCTKPAPGFCCVTDAECSMLGVSGLRPCGDNQVCDSNNACVQCNTSADCGEPTPFCMNSTCVSSCNSDEDCASSSTTPYCGASGACVACKDDSQCSTQAPVCDDSSHSCRTCAVDSECPSTVCDVDVGTCVPTSQLIYAAPDGLDTVDCSQTHPCSVSRALSLIDSLHTSLRMLPGTYDLRLSFDATTPSFSLIGTDAVLTGRSEAALAAFEVLGPTQISVRGLTVDTSKNSGITASFWCDPDGTPSSLPGLSLREATAIGGEVTSINCNFAMNHVVVRGSIGISNHGTVEIDRCRIEGQFVIGTNREIDPVVVSNSLLSGGFLFRQLVAFPLTMRFDTIYSTVAGPSLPCSDPQYVYEDDIIVSNNTDSVSGGTCQFKTNVAFPQMTPIGTGTIVADPQFVDALNGDFHIQSASPAVDAADDAPDDLDLDGVSRPQGAHSDIGAFEFHK